MWLIPSSFLYWPPATWKRPPTLAPWKPLLAEGSSPTLLHTMSPVVGDGRETDQIREVKLSLGSCLIAISRSFHLNNPSPQCWQRLGTHHNLQSQLSSVQLSFATKSPILTCLSSKRKPPHAWPLLPVTSWGSSLVNCPQLSNSAIHVVFYFTLLRIRNIIFWWMWMIPYCHVASIQIWGTSYFFSVFWFLLT